MSFTYSGTNNYGPYNPNVAGATSGISVVSVQPSAPATPEGTPANTDVTNTGRSSMATQTILGPMTFDGPQSGSPALTNVTAVTLSGYAPGQCSFVQFSGAYQSK
jgi:hypothetical protein